MLCMSSHLLDDVNLRWSNKLLESGFESFMVYKPFSDKYWKEPLKICMCNLEGYGYEDCGITLVDLPIFTQWMKDTHITKTCRYVSVFVNLLLDTFNGKKRTFTEIKDSYNDIGTLIDAMARSSYMNFRKTSNPKVSQDSNKILEEVSIFKEFIQDFINRLEPDILIIGGKIGVTAFNNIYQLEKPLYFNEYVRLNKTLVCSINHLSRPDYSYFQQKAEEIITFYNKVI